MAKQMLTLRVFLSNLIVASCVGVLPVAADDNHAPIGDGVKDLPIFDAHIHYKEPAWDAYPVESIIELMDKSGVAMGLVSSSPDEGTIMLWEYARMKGWRGT